MLPIVTIVVGALIMMALIGSALAGGGRDREPMVGVLAIAISSAASIIGILLLSWLDRWEPEPPHLLLAAFFWGGAISVAVVFVLTPLLIDPLVGRSDFAQAVIGAPLMEELAKGLFLVIVLLLSRRGRAEFNSLTDALVYAGFVGVGFSFVEDMLYLSSQKTGAEALQLAGFRIGLGAYSHSIYTAMTAIGCWLALNARNPLARVFLAFGGWCVAVLLHALHNGSTFFGSGAYFAELLLVGFPAAIAFVVIAVVSHRREGTIVQRQLPAMVYHGWLTPEEAGWIGSLPGRRERRRAAAVNAPADRKRLSVIIDAATELAFVRNRLDRQREPRSRELLVHHDELVGILTTNKQWATARLAPHHNAWAPIGGAPGVRYGPR